MCAVGQTQWALVTMTVLLLVGTAVSEDLEFPYGACDYRAWEDEAPPAVSPNCAITIAPDQYYNEENNEAVSCLPDHLSIYGKALWFPIGVDSCEPHAICIEHEDICHKCMPVPLFHGDVIPVGVGEAWFSRCQCRRGFSVERVEVDGNSFFVCKRDCEEENGGCMQRCDPPDEENPDDEAECSCAEGFDDEEDGEICKDKNECLTGENNCRLPHQCQNREGAHVCVCAPGFISSKDGKECKKATDLVCTISIKEVTAPFEMDSEEEDFGELTDTEEEKFDETNVEVMFRDAVVQSGMFAREVDVEPTFVNGHLEFQVMMQFSPPLDVEQETQVLASLSERLSRSGYTTQSDGQSVYISRPVYCFSRTTGGIPLPIDAPCEWYNMAGFCLQNSECGHDGGRAYCMCPDGWFGKRCEIGEITMVDIILIVLVAILNIMFLILCCFVCMKWRRRCHGNCGCDRCSKSSSHKATYVKTQTIQQAFPAPIKYQTGMIYG